MDSWTYGAYQSGYTVPACRTLSPGRPYENPRLSQPPLRHEPRVLHGRRPVGEASSAPGSTRVRCNRREPCGCDLDPFPSSPIRPPTCGRRTTASPCRRFARFQATAAACFWSHRPWTSHSSSSPSGMIAGLPSRYEVQRRGRRGRRAGARILRRSADAALVRIREHGRAGLTGRSPANQVRLMPPSCAVTPTIGILTPDQLGWSVYIARCGDDSLYCGIARDVEARLAAHTAGRGARYTRGRGPIQLVAAHRYRDQGTALRVEAAIKRLPRPEKLAIAQDGKRWAAVARRARSGSG